MQEFAALGSALAISEGSGCGKEFFCASPGEHLPCEPSHCLMNTGFIPLLSLAKRAQKHTRRACSSSSLYCREHLSQRHHKAGSKLKFGSAEMLLSEELTFCSILVPQTHLCLVHLLCPEQQPFLPGIIFCLIQMEQVHSEQHPASSQPAPSQERETECFHTHHISSSVFSTVTVWLKLFSQSHYHKGSLRDFIVYFISLKKAPKL